MAQLQVGLWVIPTLDWVLSPHLAAPDSCWESTSELAKLGHSALQASRLEADASAFADSEFVIQPSGQHRVDFEGKEPCLETCSGRGAQ